MLALAMGILVKFGLRDIKNDLGMSVSVKRGERWRDAIVCLMFASSSRTVPGILLHVMHPRVCGDTLRMCGSVGLVIVVMDGVLDTLSFGPSLSEVATSSTL